jgi:hypothetical protein
MKLVVGNPSGTRFPYPSQFSCVFTWLVMFITSNIWTKLQDLICFAEFSENDEILLYDNCMFCFIGKILDGSNGDVVRH